MNATLTTILALVPDFLRAVSSALANTGLSKSADTLLNTGAALVEAGDAAAGELQGLTEQIKVMVAAGRDPTEDEWNQLKARSDAAHAAIQGLLSTPPASSPSATSLPGTSANPTNPTAPDSSSTTGGA